MMIDEGNMYDKLIACVNRESRPFSASCSLRDSLPVTSYQLPVTSYQLPVTRYPITDTQAAALPLLRMKDKRRTLSFDKKETVLRLRFGFIEFSEVIDLVLNDYIFHNQFL